jgi:hypothetical protein
MKTVLFAWELGGGFGHIAAMRRYAARLAPHGVRMVAAVRNPRMARVLAELGVEVLQAPPWPEASFTRRQYAATSSATLGDSLASAGLDDADALNDLLTQWSKIFQSVKPDLVVADYAPAAALVARGRVPLMLVGNGYTVPPSDMTHFPLLHRTHEPVWDETRLLTILNTAARRHGLVTLERLPQLFSADDYLVETFPLLDPYDLQRTSTVDGPAFDKAPIARRDNADEILVYLAPGYAIRRDLIRALIPVANKIQIYAPDLSFIQRSRLKLAGATLHRERLDLAQALASAKLVVHFGGSGLAAHALAAGVPQLIFSTHIEQELNGLALQRAGLGTLVRSHDPDVAISSGIVSSTVNDRMLASRAAQSGDIHRAMLRDVNPLAAFEERSLKLLGYAAKFAVDPSDAKRPDPATWLTGDMTFSYRDPLSLPRGAFPLLFGSNDDVVCVGHSTEPSAHIFTGRHDASERVICADAFKEFPANPAPFIAARSNVVLTGYRMFLARDGEYLTDESFIDPAATTRKFGLPDQFQNEMTGFVPTDMPGRYTLSSQGKSHAVIEEPAIFLGCDEAFNYGAFTIWTLPKLIEALRFDPATKILLPVFKYTVGFLECAGIDSSRVIAQDLNCIYSLDRAIVPSARNRNFWLDNDTLAFFAAIRERIGEKQQNRKIYISRREFQKTGAGQTRIMRNEDELIAELVKRGFEIVEPQQLSPASQIKLFSSSATVVGAAGAGLFNSVYCRPGTRLICIESEPHWAAHHARIFQSRGLDCTIFEGTPSSYDFSIHHQPFSVDIPRLLDCIERKPVH